MAACCFSFARRHACVMGHMTIDYLRDSGSAVMGDPDACIAAAKRYEAIGCDLLLCLVNPYNIPHEKVMRNLELLGTKVIPELERRGHRVDYKALFGK